MRSQKGITLVALVVTIIVLLILAGVTIALVMGQDGIFNKAETASTATFKADVESTVQLSMLTTKVNSYDNEGTSTGAVTAEKYVEDVVQALTDAGYTATATATNQSPITVKKGSNQVTVTITGDKATVSEVTAAD